MSQIQQGFENSGVLGSESRPLNWTGAVALIEENNISYQQAQTRLAQLEEDRKKFYWQQLSPRLFAVANLSTALGEISNLSNDNYGVRLFGSISVPEPLGLYARRYALELNYYQASLDFELLKRRLHSNLYASFRTQEQIERGEKEIRDIKLPTSVEELLASRSTKANAESTLKSQQERSQLALNNILNTPGQAWRPVTKSAPSISYRNRLDQVTTQNGYGRLALKQAAGQLESSLARLWRLKFNRLPSFSTGVSLPTLYDSRIDTDPEIGDIRLFGSMNKSFDLSGRQARSARVAEERVKLLRSQLTQRLERENYNLQRVKSNYAELIRKEQKLKQQISREKATLPPSQPELILKHVSNIKNLLTQLENNQLAQAKLDLEFWVWDDNYWDSPF